VDDAQYPDRENYPLALIVQEGHEAVMKNVGRGEGILRVVLGIILILLGFFLSGFWMLLSVVVGGILMLAAIIGY
jgi:uncharacterized membrane protein YccF (DUF307 family)